MAEESEQTPKRGGAESTGLPHPQLQTGRLQTAVQIAQIVGGVSIFGTLLVRLMLGR
jgi:hypothetical protein